MSGGERWGGEMPSMEEARRLQTRLNAMESQIVETRDWTLRPEIFQVSIWMPSSRIYQSPWWAMAMLMTMLLMMAWCGGAKGVWADEGGNEIERYDQRLATHRVERYRAALGFASPISISVDRDSTMPKQADGRTIDAYTTRAWQAEGCTVHVTRLSVQRASIIAHEVCHCVADYAVLGPWGYVGVGASEVRERERAASRCEDGLMKRSVW